MKWTKKKILEEILLLEKRLGRVPVKRDNSNLYSLSRKYFGSWNNLMKEAGYIVKERQHPIIPKLNLRNLYYFMGLLCTDGHIHIDKEKTRNKLMIFTSNKDEREMIFKLIYNLFQYKASIREKIYGFSKRPNYEIYISSKSICEFFCNLGVPSGAKSLTIALPEIIKNCKTCFFWDFLRGVFDGDGSIINTEKSKAFKIASGSEKFLEDFKQIFINKDFSPILRKERNNLWILKFNKKEEINKIYNLLYKDAEFFYTRKKLNWERQYI
jgi:DNA-binding transcriptional regulator WhiA